MLFKLLVVLFAVSASAGAVQDEIRVDYMGEQKYLCCAETQLFTPVVNYADEVIVDHTRCSYRNYLYCFHGGYKIPLTARNCSYFGQEALRLNKDWSIQLKSLEKAGFDQTLLGNFDYRCYREGLAPLLTFNEVGVDEFEIVVCFTVIANSNDRTMLVFTPQDRVVGYIQKVHRVEMNAENEVDGKMVNLAWCNYLYNPNGLDELQETRMDVFVPNYVFECVPDMDKVNKFFEQKAETLWPSLSRATQASVKAATAKTSSKDAKREKQPDAKHR